MRNSTDFPASTPHSPVQSVLPLFDAVDLLGGAERSDAISAAERIKSARSRDPLKQARRVATALRRGEFDVGARQAAVNSLCQYLIDSLQSPANKIPH